MTRGFLILALEKESYYHMAYNLALSLKYNSQYPVEILRDEEVKISPAFKAKTHIYDLSPFDETIYVDADSLCIHSPDELFEYFKEREISFFVQKIHQYPYTGNKMIWSDMKEIADRYSW